MGQNETDEDWLNRHQQKVSENELEAFVERVAIRIADGMCELTARAESLKDLRDKRHGR